MNNEITSLVADKKIVSTNYELNARLENFYWHEISGLNFAESYKHITQSNLDQIFLAYIENFYYRFGTGIFLLGNTFAGKTTHLAYLAYRIIQESGFYGLAGQPEKSEFWSSPAKDTILYLNPMSILTNFRDVTDYRLVDFIKKAATVEYLLIDDIDRIDDRHSLIRLENIIERRYSNNLTTVITSSTGADILKSKSEYKRIMRILFESSQFVQLQSEPEQYEIKFA